MKRHLIGVPMGGAKGVERVVSWAAAKDEALGGLIFLSIFKISILFF